MKVLDIEQFANKIGQPGRAGESIGLMVAEGTKVKRGDIIVADSSFLGCEKYLPLISTIYAGLGIPSEIYKGT